MLGIQLYLTGIALQGLGIIYTLLVLIQATYRNVFNRDIQHNSILYALLSSLTLILLRTTYRLIELSAFFTGSMRFLAHSEVYFNALECAPVLLALGVWLGPANFGDGGCGYHGLGSGGEREGHTRLAV